ncbi:MAG: acyl-CoA dehydratase activase [Eubacteriales bacterium]
MQNLLGIDVGSTTVKAVVADSSLNIRYKRYERHNARVQEILLEILREIREEFGPVSVKAAVTGSAGLGISQRADLPFVQEVVASTSAIERLLPGTDAAIELGGEDAKIIFFGRVPEQRMNGTCAGGTGAFIDQMATLMDVTVDQLNELAAEHSKIYPIASRCGVFAKSDVQPLLNQGASREDIAASILQAVVNQTIAGLAQGRKIEGNVAFLGGPLAFIPQLRRRFIETLKLTDEQVRFPENAEYFVALGCAAEAQIFDEKSLDSIIEKLELAEDDRQTAVLQPLFESEAEYEDFLQRHSKATAPTADPKEYEGIAWLGIDAGSTTTKLVLMTDDCRLLYTYYAPNKGNPVQVLHDELLQVRRLCGDKIQIAGTAVTGYGEELMVNAFGADLGIVETMAHYYAARYFDPEVDYIIDIGGQDMKCFRIRNGAIDSIMLNEACSSGCGSFIETFAKAIGYSAEEFAKLGLFSKKPSDLGSRCTVFMNSSVKQAQKEGATVEDISAGLSVSVVKNALYKVIRVVDPKELGQHVVVQGGTFLNDAILRAFERELGCHVTRPQIAGLMGAFGCALYAKEKATKVSSILTLKELENFEHTSSAAVCRLCPNQCTLTINRFSGGRRFITGNKCERGAGQKRNAEKLPNLYEYKYEKLMALKSIENPTRGTIGIPMVLNFFDTLPFWMEFFNRLSIRVELSARSSHELYQRGQNTIPSDTVCYPAKLVHGHIVDLVERGITKVFYPCAPYNNVESEVADNYYNCPVVAYYPELIKANMPQTDRIDYIYPYLVITKPSFVRKAFEALKPYYPDLTLREVKAATRAARKADAAFRADIRAEGERALEFTRKNGKRAVVVAGRPYHIDPEVNHGMDRLITSLGLVLISEEAVAHLGKADKLKILNQWTYHTRMYNSADFVSKQPDVEFIQLVSFGCGTDAITGDEIRDMLERRGRLYTQIKIDEISNLGAAKIRLRSLIAAMDAAQRRSGNNG